MSDTPLKRLRLAEVPAYVLTKHGLETSRQSVYNWMKLGVGGEFLPTALSPGVCDYRPVRTTSAADVDAFLALISKA